MLLWMLVNGLIYCEWYKAFRGLVSIVQARDQLCARDRKENPIKELVTSIMKLQKYSNRNLMSNHGDTWLQICFLKV